MVGIRADEERIRELMERSLMLVTALAPKIGYERAPQIAKAAHANGTTLREEALRLGYVSAAEFDRLVRPETDDAPRLMPSESTLSVRTDSLRQSWRRSDRSRVFGALESGTYLCDPQLRSADKSFL